MSNTYAIVWLNCLCCHFSGRVLDLAAAAWDLSLTDTLTRFTELGAWHKEFPSEQLLAQIERRQRAESNLNDLVAKGCRQILNLDATGVDELREHFRIARLGYSLDQWKERGGQFIGMISNAQFRNCHKIKAHWQSAIIIPSWDFPDHLCGFGLFPNIKPKMSYKYGLGKITAHLTKHSEAGLTMLPTILKPPHPIFGDRIFAFSSAELAVGLQLRHLADNSLALPIVSWWEQGRHYTKDTWKQFCGRPIYFFAQHITPELIIQAQICDGYIMPLEEIIKLQKSSTEPAALLRYIQQYAIPWREFLVQYINTATHLEVAALLTRLRLPTYEIDTLYSKLDPALQNRAEVAKLYKSRLVYFYPQKHFSMHEDGWYSGPTDAERLSDFTYQVDYRVLCPIRKQQFHQGKLNYQGKTYDFVAPAKRSELTRWFRKFMVAKGVKDPLRLYDNELPTLAVAEHFHRPISIRIPTVVGWHNETGGFIFPRFHVLGGGRIVTTPIDIGEYDHTTPATGMNNFRDLTTEEVKLASANTQYSKLFWKVLALSVFYVVAPAFKHPTTSTVVVGKSNTEVLKLANYLGAIVDVPKGHKNYLHKWITTIDMQNFDMWKLPAHSIMATMPISVAATHVLKSNWNALTAIEAVVPHLPAATGMFIPVYIKDLMSRRMLLPSGSVLGDQIFKDLIRWFSSYGDTSIAEQVRNEMLWYSPECDWRLGMIVAALATKRPLTFLPYKIWRNHKRFHSSFYIYDDGTIALPYGAINKMIGRHKIPEMSRDELVELFRINGLSQEPRTFKDGSSVNTEWLLPSKWFLSQLDKFGVPVRAVYEDREYGKVDACN